MGLDRINETVEALCAAGIRAKRGYPAAMMPSLRGAVAAVCVESLTAGKTVLAVYICTAESGEACEDATWQAMQTLQEIGAKCSMEPCGFQSKAGVFMCRVLAHWQTAATCQVKVGSIMQEYVSKVTAQKNISRVQVTDPETGEVSEECRDMGWSVHIEELLPTSVMPQEEREDEFDLYLYRTAGGERYTKCQWVQVQLEETAEGLRRVRVARSWEPRRLLTQ